MRIPLENAPFSAYLLLQGMIFTRTTNNQKRRPLPPPKWDAVCLRSCTKAFSTGASGESILLGLQLFPQPVTIQKKETLTPPLGLTLVPMKDVGTRGCRVLPLNKADRSLPQPMGKPRTAAFALLPKTNPQSSWDPDFQRGTGLGQCHNSSWGGVSRQMCKARYKMRELKSTLEKSQRKL